MAKKSPYNTFSQIYDYITDNAFERWVPLLIKTAKKRGAHSLLDMGCGTGPLANQIADRGLEVFGIDTSKGMIAIAKKNGTAEFSVADMTDFALGKKFDIVTAIDCITHILDERDVLKAFRNARKHLNKQGVFMFEVITENYSYSMSLENGFGETVGKNAFVWEDRNVFDFHVINLSIFLKKKGNQYTRKNEQILQRLYSQPTLTSLLKKAGFSRVKAYGNAKLDPVGKKPKELVFVCER
jgi:cyclopropane fatty-acyl-phospholipid synthase-like methyltransferase